MIYHWKTRKEETSWIALRKLLFNTLIIDRHLVWARLRNIFVCVASKKELWWR